MRKALLILPLFLSLLSASAQQEFTLYQFSGIAQQNLVNPAQMPDTKWTIGFPGFSSIKTSYTNKAYAPNQGIYIQDGILYVDPEAFATNLSAKNYLNSQVQNQWFLVGFRLNKHYFKLSASEKAAVDFAFPNTLFDFVLKGNAYYLGETVSISKLKLNATNYREVSLGYAYQLNDKWQVGGHLNLLFGLANLSNQKSSLSIYTDPESYDISISGNIEINSSGLNDISGNTIDYLKTSNNFGLSLDLGVLFKPTEKWEISSSLMDLGYIRWKNDLKTLTNNNNSITIKGLDLTTLIDGGIFDGDSALIDIVDSLQNEFTLEEIAQKYTTALTPKWYGGAKFYINTKNRLYSTAMLQFYPTGVRFGMSFGYELDLNKYLGFTANYSLYANSYSNIGLGLRLQGGPIQVYIMTDSMLASFDLFNYRSVYFRFGLNVAFGEIKASKPVKNNLL
jgi:hypothetical protein